MLTAVIQNPTSGWSKPSLNWFDIVLLMVLVFGLWRGRTRGMSREVLPTGQWLVLVVSSGLGYEALAGFLTHSGLAKNLLPLVKAVFEKNATEREVAFVFSYLAIAVLVVTLGSFIKKAVKAKVEDGNLFGSSEYYLGMVAGLIRYACITLFSLALLNAPFYTPGEIQIQQDSDKREFGGGVYTGSYFPRIYSIQEQIFKQSLVGRTLKDHLSVMLINPEPTGGKKKSGQP